MQARNEELFYSIILFSLFQVSGVYRRDKIQILRFVCEYNIFINMQPVLLRMLTINIKYIDVPIVTGITVWVLTR